jgi:fumigallin biosynthesis monooxygenase-like protein
MAILKGRQQAHPDKPFALFLIGMRVNSLLAVHRWGGVARAMTRMQAELAQASALRQKRTLAGSGILLCGSVKT